MKKEGDNHPVKTLVFPCSGASDVGELANWAARRISRSGLGRMSCLAAIGGRIQEFIDNTKAAKEIIIIDGCSRACAKKTLEQINVQGEHINLADLGFKKGNSPSTSANINRIVNHISNYSIKNTIH